MPNWCENFMSVTGEEEEFNKFLKVINYSDDEATIKLFESLYPTPQDLLNSTANFAGEETATDEQKALKEKYGHYDWYSWRIDNWGTKWNENDLRISTPANQRISGLWEVAFGYETAWGPAIELFDKVSIDYPGLLFCLYYEEPGMGFCGKAVWGNGEQQYSEHGELITDYFDEDYYYEEYIRSAQVN